MATALQAALHNSRQRRRASRAPGLGLSKTHAIAAGTASVDTDELWPDRDRPITFETAIEITGASAVGIVFELGNATTGLKLAITGGALYLAAGAAAGNDGVGGSVALDWIDTVAPNNHILTVALNPGAGTALLLVNGTTVLRLDSGQAWAAGWAADDAGAVGAAAAGTGSTQRGQAVNGAPSDFALVAPLRAYQGQLYRGS